MTNVPFDLDHAQMSDAGFEVVEFFEGWETEELDAAGNWTGYYIAYKKGKDPWTIGPGLTGKFRISGKPITEGTRASHEECVDEMQLRLHNEVYPLVRKHFAPKNQDEFDACTSWVWNLDQGALERGEYSLPGMMLDVRRLTDPDLDAAITRKWVEYKNPRTQFEEGLYRRRIAERCVSKGLPWKFAPSAILERADKKNHQGPIVFQTDPFHILALAEQAAEKAPKAPVRTRGYTTDELNARERARLAGEPMPDIDLTLPPLPLPKPAKAKPAPAPPVEAPKVDVAAPPKPMEESKTHKGLSKKESGQETVIIGGTVTGIGALLPNIQSLTNYLQQFPMKTILMAVAVIGVAIILVGLWRWYAGRMIAYEGRQEATMTKV